MLLGCFTLVVCGVLLMVVGNRLNHLSGWGWLKPLPWNELGGILIGAGVLSVWLDRYFQVEQAAIDELRLRRLLHEQAPAMRDAVLEAFAANQADLARVATPETLDQIITNSLALRLHDPQFAEEVYSDIRDQAIRAGERWYDASLSIELAPLPASWQRKPNASGPPPSHFIVTVRWEYSTIPRHPQRRFVCLSDREDYAELANEGGSTSAWYLKPGTGVDATSSVAYELMRFSVDGAERTIRRAVRKDGQVYTVNIGEDAIESGQPVSIAYTYRTITSQAGHLLFFDIEQPTRDLRVEFDYSACNISSVSALDLIPSVRPSRIERSPAQVPGKTIRVNVDGWIFPRSGIAFVWTLNKEVDVAERRRSMGSQAVI